jgi:uncharacterized protein (DUF488 family)
LSRRPGFSKTGLAAALEQAGIAYEHRRELGNPFRRTGTLEDYRVHLPREALEALRATLGTPTAILCVEADPAHCHRRVIAEELGVAGTEI